MYHAAARGRNAVPHAMTREAASLLRGEARCGQILAQSFELSPKDGSLVQINRAAPAGVLLDRCVGHQLTDCQDHLAADQDTWQTPPTFALPVPGGVPGK
jgi:hypothetical protein